jgi:hypothetical protein
MRNVITTIVVVVAIGLYAYPKWHRARLAAQPAASTEKAAAEEEDQPIAIERDERFRCDGRTRCSQFDSCEEATWFINNCPGMKMDGDNDGVPCEDHHCPHS